MALETKIEFARSDMYEFQKSNRTRLWNNLFLLIAIPIIAILLTQANIASAQDDDDDLEEKQPPEVQEVVFATEDGVQMTASYYGSVEGKKAALVILLHDYAGNRKDFDSLARFLQSKGFAVLAPDLRGHGGSTKYIPAGTKTPIPIAVSLKRFKEKDYLRMVSKDMEAVRNFIVKENDSEKLNMDKTCIVGAGLGAIVAMKYALEDWRHAPVAGQKKGQDIKAVVLLTPLSKIRHLKISKNDYAISKLISTFTLIASGAKNSKSTAKVYKELLAAHKKLKGDKKFAPTMATLASNLLGTKLLGVKNLHLATYTDPKKSPKPQPVSGANLSVEISIAQFLNSRVREEHKKSRWVKRGDD